MSQSNTQWRLLGHSGPTIPIEVYLTMYIFTYTLANMYIVRITVYSNPLLPAYHNRSHQKSIHYENYTLLHTL